jgi:3-deoxy-D-manno-octulosonic-acid transferase
MYFLYSCCFTLAFLIAFPYFLVRGILQRKYFSNFRQRLGWFSLSGHQPPDGGLWIHAVSVGEVLAVVPLVRELKSRWPERRLYVSTTTHTGQTLASQRLGDIATILYFPFDWRFSVRHALDRVGPAAILITETEIWPNFLRECTLRRIPVVLVNGRISDRSVNRYNWIRPFIRRSLADFSRLLMQTAKDRERIVSLGAAPDRTEVCGNLKFDLKPVVDPGQVVEKYRRMLGLREDSLVVVAGSTMKGEEEQFLVAFGSLRRQYPSTFLVLAPRHPERFNEVEQLLSGQPLSFGRRSSLDERRDRMPVDILLLDTMGELASLYALADIVFIGGSLVARGGHNILEPALFKKPVLFGPHMNNFREVALCFLQQQAAFQVSNSADLAARLVELARDKKLRGKMGENGFQILHANSGATERILRHVEAILKCDIKETDDREKR